MSHIHIYSVLLYGLHTCLCMQRAEPSEDENNLFRHIPMISLVILLIRCKAYAIYRLDFLPIVECIMRLAILIQRSAHARLSSSSSRPHLRSLPPPPPPCDSANVVASSTIPVSYTHLIVDDSSDIEYRSRFKRADKLHK